MAGLAKPRPALHIRLILQQALAASENGTDSLIGYQSLFVLCRLGEFFHLTTVSATAGKPLLKNVCYSSEESLGGLLVFEATMQFFEIGVKNRAVWAVLCMFIPAASALGGPRETGEHLDNPFVGATFYRNVDYVAAVKPLPIARPALWAGR